LLLRCISMFRPPSKFEYDCNWCCESLMNSLISVTDSWYLRWDLRACSFMYNVSLTSFENFWCFCWIWFIFAVCWLDEMFWTLCFNKSNWYCWFSISSIISCKTSFCFFLQLILPWRPDSSLNLFSKLSNQYVISNTLFSISFACST